jgi:hypothetical protein
MADLHHFIGFRDGGGGHLERWPHFRFCADCTRHVFLKTKYQISSISDDKWPTKIVALIFKMAVAAIFENGRTLPVSCFLDFACSFQSVYQISSYSGDKWPVHSISLVLQHMHAEIGV